MAKHIRTVISNFWVSKFAQYTIQKTAPIGPALNPSLQRPCFYWSYVQIKNKEVENIENKYLVMMQIASIK